jgi:hypothetical protein
LETQNQLPLWKATVWFEEIKEEEAYWNIQEKIIRDYRITFKDELKEAFLKDADKRVTWASELNYTCAGGVI